MLSAFVMLQKSPHDAHACAAGKNKQHGMSELVWLDLGVKFPTLELPSLRQWAQLVFVDSMSLYVIVDFAALEAFYPQDERLSNKALGVIPGRAPRQNKPPPTGCCVWVCACEPENEFQL